MQTNAAAAQEANRLYWHTDRSIADIAETLGVSRRALYELVEPQSAGVACENCGADVVFANRSAKTAQLARCPACGSECQLTTEEYAEQDDNDIGETIPPYVAGWPRARSAAADHSVRDRALRIGAAAIAGAAVGALTALLIVRRR